MEKTNISENLYRHLTELNPSPWSVEYHVEHPELVRYVLDRKGQVVFEMETYTGDGDHINLPPEALMALVAFVNGYQVHQT